MSDDSSVLAVAAPISAGWRWWNLAVCIGVCIAILVIALSQPTLDQVLPIWILTMALLGVVMAVVGQGITGKWTGILIDESNHINLTRLQMVVWTVIILAAFLAKYLANQLLHIADPLAIVVPEQLWGILGINAVSLVGSQIIDRSKLNQPTPGTVPSSDLATRNITVSGQLATNSTAAQARATDVFKGEEVGNFQTVDIGKLQMFFFSLMLVAAYSSSLYFSFKSLPTLDPTKLPPGISDLPALSNGMLALLGISHAGFLANKAAPHS